MCADIPPIALEQPIAVEPSLAAHDHDAPAHARAADIPH